MADAHEERRDDEAEVERLRRLGADASGGDGTVRLRELVLVETDDL